MAQVLGAGQETAHRGVRQRGRDACEDAQRSLLTTADAGVGPLAEYMFDKLGVDPAEAERAVPALPT